MSAKSRPSATSLMVKSNSLRATKSIGAPRLQALLRLDRDLGADEADLQRSGSRPSAPPRPCTSAAKDGVRGVDHAQLVAARQRPAPAAGRCRAGGASISLLPGTRAAGWASQVGYQKRADLALRLVARAGAAVEAVEGRRLQEQRLHHARSIPSPVPGRQRQGAGAVGPRMQRLAAPLHPVARHSSPASRRPT